MLPRETGTVSRLQKVPGWPLPDPPPARCARLFFCRRQVRRCTQVVAAPVTLMSLSFAFLPGRPQLLPSVTPPPSVARRRQHLYPPVTIPFEAGRFRPSDYSSRNGNGMSGLTRGSSAERRYGTLSDEVREERQAMMKRGSAIDIDRVTCEAEAERKIQVMRAAPCQPEEEKMPRMVEMARPPYRYIVRRRYPVCCSPPPSPVTRIREMPVKQAATILRRSVHGDYRRVRSPAQRPFCLRYACVAS